MGLSQAIDRYTLVMIVRLAEAVAANVQCEQALVGVSHRNLNIPDPG